MRASDLVVGCLLAAAVLAGCIDTPAHPPPTEFEGSILAETLELTLKRDTTHRIDLADTGWGRILADLPNATSLSFAIVHETKGDLMRRPVMDELPEDSSIYAMFGFWPDGYIDTVPNHRMMVGWASTPERTWDFDNPRAPVERTLSSPAEPEPVDAKAGLWTVHVVTNIAGLSVRLTTGAGSYGWESTLALIHHPHAHRLSLDFPANPRTEDAGTLRVWDATPQEYNVVPSWSMFWGTVVREAEIVMAGGDQFDFGKMYGQHCVGGWSSSGLYHLEKVTDNPNRTTLTYIGGYPPTHGSAQYCGQYRDRMVLQPSLRLLHSDMIQLPQFPPDDT